jgi:hypothetical protein
VFTIHCSEQHCTSSIRFSTASVILGISVYSRGTDHTENSLHRCIMPLLGVPRDRYLGSPLARWLLPSTDHIKNISTVLLTACVCVGLFTELLPGNAFIKSVTVLKSCWNVGPGSQTPAPQNVNCNGLHKVFITHHAHKQHTIYSVYTKNHSSRH